MAECERNLIRRKDGRSTHFLRNLSKPEDTYHLRTISYLPTWSNLPTRSIILGEFCTARHELVGARQASKFAEVWACPHHIVVNLWISARIKGSGVSDSESKWIHFRNSFCVTLLLSSKNQRTVWPHFFCGCRRWKTSAWIVISSSTLGRFDRWKIIILLCRWFNIGSVVAVRIVSQRREASPMALHQKVSFALMDVLWANKPYLSRAKFLRIDRNQS